MAEIRREEIEKATHIAFARICGPGNFFSGERRKAVALEAIHSWGGHCVVCRGVRKICPGSSTFSLLDLPDFLVSHDTLDGTLEDSLILLIHSATNLQHLVTKSWHTEVLSCMSREVREMSNLDELDVLAAFSELLIITSWSVGISAVFQTLGEPMPHMPEPGEGNPKRLLASSFAERLCDDPRVGFSPWIKSLIPGSIEQFRGFGYFVGNSISPLAQVTLAAAESWHFARWEAVVYMPTKDVKAMRSPPESRILSRPELETIAASLTGALACSF